MSRSDTFEIRLPQFEGPFDLLLFFIERDELDIHDIPISKITADFLEYIHQMNQLNIEVASEFILVAATLMRIKAKMLLPRKELDEFGNEIDPRKELVDRLVEYKRYKDVIGDLEKLEDERRSKMQRGNVLAEQKILARQFSNEMELSSINLFSLLKVFEKVMDRYRNQPEEVDHVVFQFNYTLENEADTIMGICRHSGRVDFEELFKSCADRQQAIFRFLSILDLIQLQQIDLLVGDGFNQFWVSINTKHEKNEA